MLVKFRNCFSLNHLKLHDTVTIEHNVMQKSTYRNGHLSRILFCETSIIELVKSVVVVY